MALVHRRMAACIVVTWLPLAVMTALAGSFISGVQVPFLYDLGVHARLLLCVPLLIAAEVIAHRRMRNVVGEFLDRGLIAPADRSRFEAIVDSAMRVHHGESHKTSAPCFAASISWLSSSLLPTPCLVNGSWT